MQTKPFIAAKLSSDVFEVEPQPFHARSFILDLGVLLWELFFGRKITITDEDKEMGDEEEEEDEYLSLFNALNREECDSREWCVDAPSLDIIANCLNLYGQFEDVDDASFRTEMYWNVVNPLDCLESYGRPEKDQSQAARKATHQLITPSVPLPSFSITPPASSTTSELLASQGNVRQHPQTAIVEKY